MKNLLTIIMVFCSAVAFAQTPIYKTTTGALNGSNAILRAGTDSFNIKDSLALKSNDNGVVKLTGNQTIGGVKTFSSDAVINGLTVGRGGGNVEGNTASGSSALNANTTGSYNTANGGSAGSNNATGNNSVFIGQNSQPSSTNQDNQIVIGSNATGSGSNTATLGNASITSTILRGAVTGGSFARTGGLSTDAQMANGTVKSIGNVDNTTDANKPISTAAQTALDAKASNTDVALKANIASPTFTGILNLGDTSSIGNFIRVEGSPTDNTYDGLIISSKFPRLTLEDTNPSGSSFNIWNLGTTMRFGTNTASQENSAWFTRSGDKGNVIFNGSVGIGTTTLTERLTVAGRGLFSGTVTAPTFVGDLTGTASGNTTGSGTTNQLAKFTASGVVGNSQVTDNGSNFSINKSNNAYSRFLVNDGTDINFGLKSGQTNSSAMMLNFVNDAVTANIPAEFRASSFDFTLGNVGINQTNPTEKLDVVGNGKFSGTVTAPTFVGALTGTASNNELISNKSTSTTLGTSNTLYPSQNAVKVYVDSTADNSIDKFITTVSNSGATNTTLYTSTVIANSLVSNGSKIDFNYTGRFASNGNTKTLGIRFGTGYTLGNTSVSGKYWSVRGSITRLTSTSALLDCVLNTDGSYPVVLGNLILSLDYTADINLLLEGQGSATGDVSVYTGRTSLTP